MDLKIVLTYSVSLLALIYTAGGHSVAVSIWHLE